MGGRGSRGGGKKGSVNTNVSNLTTQLNNSSNKGGGGGGGGSKGNKGGGSGTGGLKGGGNGNGGGTADNSNTDKDYKVEDTFPFNLRRKENLSREKDSELEADAEAVNRRWSEHLRWQINCQRCTAAHELRARGYDVKARPKDEGSKLGSVDDIANMWRDPKTGKAGQWEEVWNHQGGVTSQQVAEQMEQKIKGWEDGSRGFVYVQWAQGSAHIFNVEVRDGKVIYTDAQVNKVNAQQWKKRLKPTAWHAVMRVDHLQPTDVVETWIKERDEFEIKAPDYDKFLKFLAKNNIKENSWEGTALYNGWYQVWTGQNPPTFDPNKIKPEYKKFWELGVKFGRVPS